MAWISRGAASFQVKSDYQFLTACRFGKLRLYGTIRVGKDRQSWQELECFLFAEMLICVKEKKGAPTQYADGNSKRKMTRCTLKGSILIKKHLKRVDSNPGITTFIRELQSVVANNTKLRRTGFDFEPYRPRTTLVSPSFPISKPA